MSITQKEIAEYAGVSCATVSRIMNNPDDIVDEMLNGFLKAHADIVEATDNKRVVKAKYIPKIINNG